MVGTYLPGIFDKYRGNPSGEEVDHQRTFAGGPERGRCRHAAGDCAAAGTQRVSPRGIELPVALGALRVAIDVGKVIPDAQQMGIPLALEGRADILVRLGGCPIKGGGRRRAVARRFSEVLFRNGDAAEKQFLRTPEPHAALFPGLGRVAGAPDFVQRRIGCKDWSMDLRHGDAGGANRSPPGCREKWLYPGRRPIVRHRHGRRTPG